MAADDAITLDAFNKQYKEIFHRNAMEKIAFDKEYQHLESQRKAFKKQINKEELEMRKLLQKLKVDRSPASGSDSPGTVPYCVEEINCEEECYSESFPDGAEVFVNPYPVTFKTSTNTETRRPLSAYVPAPARRITLSGHEAAVSRRRTASGNRLTKERRKTVSGCGPGNEHTNAVSGYDGDVRYCYRGRRKSVEYEDIFSTPDTRSLPPIKVGSTASASSSQLSRFSSLRSLSSTTDCSNVWMGDPHAIASVRRPRLTVSEQKQRLTEIRSGLESIGTTQPRVESPRGRERKTPEKNRTISRHLSLKEKRTSAGTRADGLDLAMSPRIFVPLSRPRSLPDLGVSIDPSEFLGASAEVVPFPPMKQSALPFPIAQGEKEWRINLKLRRSAKRPRCRSGSSITMIANDSKSPPLSPSFTVHV